MHFRTAKIRLSFDELDKLHIVSVRVKDGQHTPFHFFKLPLKNPMRTTWTNRMGKKEGKDGFMVTSNTKVCDNHFSSNDIQKVPGGKRWQLKDSAIPFKAGTKPCCSFEKKITNSQKKIINSQLV